MPAGPSSRSSGSSRAPRSRSSSGRCSATTRSSAPPVEVAPSRAAGPIVAVVRDERRADDLLEIAAPLTRERERELILVRLLRDSDDLAEQQAELARRREALATGGVSARVAAYTSARPGRGGRAAGDGAGGRLRPRRRAVAGARDRRARARPRGHPRADALRCRDPPAGRATPGQRPGRHAVRRGRARLVGDRGRGLARPVARHGAPAPRNGGRPCGRTARREPAARPGLAARPAGDRDHDRADARPGGRATAFSRRRATRSCSSSDCPSAGGARASAELASPSPQEPARRRFSSAAACARAGSPRSETLTRFTWTLTGTRG